MGVLHVMDNFVLGLTIFNDNELVKIKNDSRMGFILGVGVIRFRPNPDEQN
jgi:hypothetical protein